MARFVGSESVNKMAMKKLLPWLKPDKCKHEYEFDRGCGCEVCIKCGDHKGLARCFCGFGLASGDRCEYWG